MLKNIRKNLREIEIYLDNNVGRNRRRKCRTKGGICCSIKKFASGLFKK